MKRVLTIIFILTGVEAFAQSGVKSIPSIESWSQKIGSTVMTTWKDSLVPGKFGTASWSYEQGVVLKGIEGLWKATGEGKYFNYLQKSMDFFVDDEGSIRTYKEEEYNIDNITPGRALLLLYKVTGKEKYFRAVNQLRDQLRHQPRTSEAGFWHKKIYPSQMWLDGLYMAEPFYAEYASTFHEDSAFNDIARQFILMEKNSRDPKTGLLYHGYDELRQQKWADKQTGRSPNCWARAMGWYGMALVDVLENFPAHHPKRAALLDILGRYAKVVAAYQDKRSGLWWNILDAGGKEKNYLEASASGMFVYTLAKGVRLGYLPATYLPFAERGYEGLVTNFIKTDESGQVNLRGTVRVSGLGGNPYRDGSYEYYMSEKVVMNDPKGMGAFIQAANEIEMLPTLSYGKGKKVLLDYFFNHETRKDVTGATVQYHYVWDELDNNGYSLLGFVFNKYGVKTGSLAMAPTAQNLKEADIYIIVDPDTIKENPQPNYIEPAHINVIYDWVKKGGVLFLFGNDSPNVEFTHFNQLAAKFGIRFNYDSRNKVIGNQYEMGTLNVLVHHPIFKTARKIYIKEYSSQTVRPPAHPVFVDDNIVVMSVARVGKGVVFAVGDPWFYNEYFDGRKLPVELENYKAGVDLIRWAIDEARKK